MVGVRDDRTTCQPFPNTKPHTHPSTHTKQSQLSAQHMRIFSSLAELRSSLEPNASRGNGGGGGGGDGPARSLAESSADVRMALPAPMYEVSPHFYSSHMVIAAFRVGGRNHGNLTTTRSSHALPNQPQTSLTHTQQMAQALEERLAAIRASVDDQRAKRAPATFHIAGPMEGFCRVCEVDKCVLEKAGLWCFCFGVNVVVFMSTHTYNENSLEGPGLAACEQAAVCDDNEQKATAEEEPPGLLNFECVLFCVCFLLSRATWFR